MYQRYANCIFFKNLNAPSTINAGTLNFNIFLFDFYGLRDLNLLETAVCGVSTQSPEGAAADICLQQFDFIKLIVPYV